MAALERIAPLIEYGSVAAVLTLVVVVPIAIAADPSAMFSVKAATVFANSAAPRA